MMFKKISVAVLASLACYVNAQMAPAAAPAAPAAPAAFAPQANSAPDNGQLIYKACNKPGQFVLTFDDGPNPLTTPIALETLKKYGIKATFFINGINYGNLEADQSAVDLVIREFNEGHEIGSHTYYHEDLFEAIQKNNMETNIDKMTETIKNIINVTPKYFRPPAGSGGYDEVEPDRIAMSDKIRQALQQRGYKIIMWGTDTRDWEFKTDPDVVDKVIKNLNEQLTAPGVSPSTNSFITLLHDVHETTVTKVLPQVIEYIQGLGYTFVPLSECIGVSPYQDAVIGGSTSGQENFSNLNNAEQAQNNVQSDASIVSTKMIFTIASAILSLFFLY